MDKEAARLIIDDLNTFINGGNSLFNWSLLLNDAYGIG